METTQQNNMIVSPLKTLKHCFWLAQFLSSVLLPLSLMTLHSPSLFPSIYFFFYSLFLSLDTAFFLSFSLSLSLSLHSYLSVALLFSTPLFISALFLFCSQLLPLLPLSLFSPCISLHLFICNSVFHSHVLSPFISLFSYNYIFCHLYCLAFLIIFVSLTRK